jgi:hypothetical protein
VGYNRAFLDDYRPNDTFYLSPDTRQRLLECGRSPDGERPAGTYARQIFNRLLNDLSWNSSRLEGNTYSLLETERLLELGETAEGKDVLEIQMILNHKAAIELLVEQAEEVGFNRYTILNLHALLSDNLLGNPQACGRLRTIGFGIGGTVYYPLEVPQLIEECFQQVLDTAAAVKDPFEQAFFVMVHLPYLQPFEDVNRRVSRLAANLPLIRLNLCPLSFVDVPERAYVEGVLGFMNSIASNCCATCSSGPMSVPVRATRRYVARWGSQTLFGCVTAHSWRKQYPKSSAIVWTRKPRRHSFGDLLLRMCHRRIRRVSSRLWKPNL